MGSYGIPYMEFHRIRNVPRQVSMESHEFPWDFPWHILWYQYLVLSLPFRPTFPCGWNVSMIYSMGRAGDLPCIHGRPIRSPMGSHRTPSQIPCDIRWDGPWYFMLPIGSPMGPVTFHGNSYVIPCDVSWNSATSHELAHRPSHGLLHGR